jgi:predicted nucleic acid-binding protein
MDPSPLASTPFSGDEVRLLTYIRPQGDLDQRGRATMGYSRVGSSDLTVVTRNVRDFSRFDVRLLNPFE